MTDRIKGLVVTLDHDIREDDCQPLIDAIRQLRGVLSVSASVAHGGDHMARERVRHELREKLLEVLS